MQRIAVTGAGGTVGSGLSRYMEAQGHEVVPLVRGPARHGEVHWDPNGQVDLHSMAGVDAVVHLAGEPIDSRWTRSRKRAILDSRRQGTHTLATALAAMDEPPRVMVSTSAAHYYGDRGEDVLHEDDGPGNLYLSEVCQAWEAAAEPAREAGIRVVHPRFALVLSQEGGALKRMLPPFRMGIGGPVGHGDQWWPWILRIDLVRAIAHLIDTDIAGPVNVTAPPVRSREFAHCLGTVLGKPAKIPLPSAAVKMLFGEMGEELLLSSVRMGCKRLLDSGFEPQFPHLEVALRHELGLQREEESLATVD